MNLKLALLSASKPSVIDDLGNGHGTVLYNHHIKEVSVIESNDTEGGGSSVTVTTDDDKNATGKRWQYDSLRVEYPTTANHIFETLIGEVYPVDVQQKLYNDYQAAAFGLSDDDEAETKYKAFLKDRIALKSMVKADCESNNIPESI